MKQNRIDSANRLGGTVISDRIVESLLAELRSGQFRTSTHLPAEIELAGVMGVSRTVIRDALSTMEREGYIERVRGIGTVVNRDVLDMKNRLDQKLEYYPLIRSLGGFPHSDCIQVSCIRPAANIAASLNLAPGEEVICIKKRVLADTRPVIYSIDYLPKALFAGKDYSRMDLSPSVFDILEQQCGQQISSNVAHLKACCGDDSLRNMLRLNAGDALLLLDEVCYNRLCRPVMRSFSYYTDYFDFSILRKLI